MEKADLKLNIRKTKIMASSPITSWQLDGGTVETVADFIFGGPKITADGDCSHEIKDAWSLEKSYDQPRQHIEKAMTPHSGTLAWKIPWTEEPGRL